MDRKHRDPDGRFASGEGGGDHGGGDGGGSGGPLESEVDAAIRDDDGSHESAATLFHLREQLKYPQSRQGLSGPAADRLIGRIDQAIGGRNKPPPIPRKKSEPPPPGAHNIYR